MKALVLCLHTATAVALRSGVYILDHIGDSSQFYNPITPPHSQANLGLNFRGTGHRVIETLVAKTKCAPLVARNA